MTLDPQALTAAESRIIRALRAIGRWAGPTLSAAIEAALEGPAQTGWQDISTAPKNRPIFLWGYLECSALSRPHVGCDDRYEAVWHAEFEAWQAVGYGGWIVQPTHWHPTPEPPVGSGQNLADANSKSPIQAREE
ncbi:hypothetical protein [Bosea sp. (in: a-proteobacteria)]|uniref:hypothetical protein n=1 Tax=Bosea sp. (in: a-proteobacteria) TaxID=1871050 RepID=UPI0026187C47|nr:hypothetical protein [Bosea sp. (in: a-proteobacteria)]MCO5092014.1 hypothetical protein [Bosea sp. (in: a-proteobacteria)]